MNYEFHVGDYIENREGDVGWVTSVTDEKVVWETNNGKTYVMEVPTLNRVQHPEALFVRIGAYDFTKKEKKKIERLSEDDSWLTFRNTNKANVNLCYIIKRINELVDAVNKLRSDYDEHIEAHRQTDR